MPALFGGVILYINMNHVVGVSSLWVCANGACDSHVTCHVTSTPPPYLLLVVTLVTLVLLYRNYKIWAETLLHNVRLGRWEMTVSWFRPATICGILVSDALESPWWYECMHAASSLLPFLLERAKQLQCLDHSQRLKTSSHDALCYGSVT